VGTSPRQRLRHSDVYVLAITARRYGSGSSWILSHANQAFANDD
jgi:hypothetical protein